mgnify:CR=1 FL=1
MDRRKEIIHALLGTMVHVEVDRPIGHCHKGMVYPVNYGYIPGIIAPDGEEQDAYILGMDEPVKEFTSRIIAIIRRTNDVEVKWVGRTEWYIFETNPISNIKSGISAKLL